MVNHTGPLTKRERTWMILFIVSLCMTFVFGWVFSALLQALLSGCPLNDRHYCSSEWQTTIGILWPIFCGLFGASFLFFCTVLILRVTPWYTVGVGGRNRIRTGPSKKRQRTWGIMMMVGIASLCLWVALTVAFLFIRHAPGAWTAFLSLTVVSFIYVWVVSVLRCTPWYKQGGEVLTKDIEEEPIDDAPHYEDVVREPEATPIEYHHDVAKK